MTAKEPFSYVVLRYIHDVRAGEFVNVGLVVALTKRPLVLANMRKTYGRIKKVFPDLDSYAYKCAIEAVEHGMKCVERSLKEKSLFEVGKTAGDYARIALPHDDSSLQWSHVGFGLTEDPQKTFDRLYHRLVSQYDRVKKRRRSDEDVWRPVEAKLKEHGVNVELETKRIEGKADSVEFRHAFKNGRWNVYEPLSFDLSDAENIKDKARRWLGHLSAVKTGTTEDVQVHFIVGRPKNSYLVPAYQSAVEILSQVPFDNTVFDEDQIEDFVKQIEAEVRHHERRTQSPC